MKEELNGENYEMNDDDLAEYAENLEDVLMRMADAMESMDAKLEVIIEHFKFGKKQ